MKLDDRMTSEDTALATYIVELADLGITTFNTSVRSYIASCTPGTKGTTSQPFSIGRIKILRYKYPFFACRIVDTSTILSHEQVKAWLGEDVSSNYVIPLNSNEIVIPSPLELLAMGAE